MADDYANIAGSLFNEGAPHAGTGDYHDPAAIYEGFSDMYGGPFGRFLTAAGGITGMPDQNGSSGSVIPGADGGSATPPNRENEMLSPNGLPLPPWTPHGHGGSGGPDQVAAASALVIATAMANAPHEVNTGVWGVPGFGWSGHWPNDPSRTIWFTGNSYGPGHGYDNGEGIKVFPGNPANNNKKGPHNWDSYRMQGNPNPPATPLFGEPGYWGASMTGPGTGTEFGFQYNDLPGFFSELPDTYPDLWLNNREYPKGVPFPWELESPAWSDVRPGHEVDPIELYWARKLLQLPDQ